jgi:proline iminopeptidase
MARLSPLVHVSLALLAAGAPLRAAAVGAQIAPIREPDAAARPGGAAREARIPVGGTQLHSREIGKGTPIIVLHGGPDFDHRYLLPDMDRLADAFRLIYYDQRGRGRSAAGVEPADVTLESEMADLEAVRRHFAVDSAVLLGHSWGTLLALEYALRHPERVSCLILMNPAPASHADFQLLRRERRERWAADVEQLKAMAATAGYKEGDPDAVAAYYRIHFKAALKRSEDLEKVLSSLKASFTRDGILKARAVEDRLLQETWLAEGYDLHPRLGKLQVPTLVIYGDHEFIPAACANHIAAAIPTARLVTMKDCGHFSYLECPDAVGKEIRGFLSGLEAPGRRRSP